MLIFLTIFPLCCLQFAMLLVFNFPDAAGDEAVGKETLVVKMGPERASHLYFPALLGAYGSLPLLFFLGLPTAVAVSILIPFPLALWMARRMRRGDWADPTDWNGLAFWSIALLFGTAACEFSAYLILLAEPFSKFIVV